jgi:hypothetical protein
MLGLQAVQKSNGVCVDTKPSSAPCSSLYKISAKDNHFRKTCFLPFDYVHSQTRNNSHCKRLGGKRGQAGQVENAEMRVRWKTRTCRSGGKRGHADTI